MRKKINELPNRTKGIYTLPKGLHQDVNHLEQARNQIVTQIRQLQTEASGMEAAIMAYFKSDAVTNNGMKPNQRIEFLGNFKYRIVAAPKSEQQPALEDSGEGTEEAQ